MSPEERKTYYNEYRLKHRERLNAYQKDYYLQNKSKQLEKILCQCGRFYDSKHKIRHFNTSIHKRNVLNEKESECVEKCEEK